MTTINRLLVILITSASAILTTFGLTISVRSIGAYGLVSSLSYLYLIGFSLLLIAFAVELINTKISAATLYFLIIIIEFYLWVQPLFVFPGLPFPAAGHDLQFYTQTQSIVDSGHLDTSVYIWQSWPGSFLQFAILKLFLPTIDYVWIFQFAPFFENLFITLILYVFLNSIFHGARKDITFLALLLVQLFNFSEVFTTVSPFSFGYLIFYTCVFLALSTRAYYFRAKSAVWLLLFVGAESISHPEIAFSMIMGLSGFLLYETLRKRETFPSLLRFVVIGITVIAAWTLYAGISFLHSFGMAAILNDLFHFEQAIVSGSTERFSNISKDYTVINTIRLSVFLVLILASLPTFLKGWISRNESISRLTFFSIGIGLSLIVIGELQGNDYTVRIFAYLLPIIAMTGAVTILGFGTKMKALLLLIIMVSGAPLSYTVIYGNLSVDNVSQVSLQSSIYFNGHSALNNLTQTVIVEDSYLGYFGHNLNSLYPHDYALMSNTALTSNTYPFVILGEGTAAYEAYLKNDSSFIIYATNKMEANSNYDLVYCSQTIDLFARAAP